MGGMSIWKICHSFLIDGHSSMFGSRLQWGKMNNNVNWHELGMKCARYIRFRITENWFVFKIPVLNPYRWVTILLQAEAKIKTDGEPGGSKTVLINMMCLRLIARNKKSSLFLKRFGQHFPNWLCFSTSQHEFLSMHWTSGPTLKHCTAIFHTYRSW